LLNFLRLAFFNEEKKEDKQLKERSAPNPESKKTLKRKQKMLRNRQRRCELKKRQKQAKIDKRKQARQPTAVLSTAIVVEAPATQA
jgi:hypothetical protein